VSEGSNEEERATSVPEVHLKITVGGERGHSILVKHSNLATLEIDGDGSQHISVLVEQLLHYLTLIATGKSSHCGAVKVRQFCGQFFNWL
jgi:hypothetical protein